MEEEPSKSSWNPLGILDFLRGAIGIDENLLQLPSAGEGHEPEPAVISHGSKHVVACTNEVDDVSVLVEEVGGIFGGILRDLCIVYDVHYRT